MLKEGFELNESTLAILGELGDYMPGGFFIYRDEGDGEVLYANHATLETFGCQSVEEFKELTGNTFKGMIYPEDYEVVHRAIAEHARSADGKTDHVEYRIVRKDGAVRWVDDYGYFTQTAAYGGVHNVFFSDITEKREAMETDLAVRQAVIQALSEAYHTVWIINDLEKGTFSLYRGDTQGQTMHGAPIRDALNQMRYPQAHEYYVRATVAPVDQPRLMEELKLENLMQRLRETPHFDCNYLRMMDDGSERYFRIEFAKLTMPDGKMGVVCGFKNVDAEMRKALEQSQALSVALASAQQANAAKTAFLSSMSHEIRTPMNAIIGLNSLALADSDLPPHTRGYLEQTGESARHLLDIINDVLDMSRIESGKMVVKTERFSLDQTIGQVSAIIEGQCRDKGLNYECHVGEGVSGYYLGDDTKIRQVMVNILGNAVKFTPEGGSVTLDVERTARFDGRSTIRFTMSDTGIGMSEEFLPHLFEAFSQEDSSVTNAYGSTGLGMPIAKSIVELMSGHIEVESCKGQGTTFAVTITLADAAATAESPSRDDVDLSGRRILLAEDMAINAEIMVRMLGMHGMEVEVAENGRMATERFFERPEGYYDAILMDMRMPEMSGLEATRIIRGSGRSDACEIPIVALTANAFDEDVQHSMQAGLDAHLSKPVEPETLLQTLKGLLARA